MERILKEYWIFFFSIVKKIVEEYSKNMQIF